MSLFSILFFIGTENVIYGHLFHCWRKELFQSQCVICVKIIRWEADKKVNFNFMRVRDDLKIYKFTEDIFCSPRRFSCLQTRPKECAYFDTINNPREVREKFAVIAVRILINSFQKKFFINEDNVKLTFYYYISELSSKLFDKVLDRVDRYKADFLFENYIPDLDYNFDSIKVINSH